MLGIINTQNELLQFCYVKCMPVINRYNLLKRPVQSNIYPTSIFISNIPFIFLFVSFFFFFFFSKIMN